MIGRSADVKPQNVCVTRRGQRCRAEIGIGRAGASRSRTTRATRNCPVVLGKRQCPHPLLGGRLRLPAAGHPRRRLELPDQQLGDCCVQRPGGLQRRFPLHHDGPTQCEWRRVHRADPGRRPMGRLRRRSAGADRPSRHPAVLFMGYCIGGPFALKLMERAPQRVVAGSSANRSGTDRRTRTSCTSPARMSGPPELLKRRPELTMAQGRGVSGERDIMFFMSWASRDAATSIRSTCAARWRPLTGGGGSPMDASAIGLGSRLGRTGFASSLRRTARPSTILFGMEISHHD